MAIGVVVAPLAGLYAAIFVLPAILQLGFRERFRWLPWAVAVFPWLVVLALAPSLLGPDPYLVLADLSVIDFALLAATYPLLRLPPIDATSIPTPGSAALPASAA
jgi:hypothetical protein